MINSNENKYIFNRQQEDGTFVPEKVALERWCWGVVYNDDTEFYQFDNDGTFHQFKEIDQSQLEMFTMYKMDDQSKRYDVAIDPERYEAVHFYRHLILNHGTDEARQVKVYGYGIKDKVTGSVLCNYILPDDRIVTGSKDIDLTQYNL